MLEKFQIGKKFIIQDMVVRITHITKIKNNYVIYADIVKQNKHTVCCTTKIQDNAALICRDKETLLKMGLNSQERYAIYCHELGHCFSENKKTRKKHQKEKLKMKLIVIHMQLKNVMFHQ